MPVPAPLLRLVEAHSCFSGCYSPDGELMCWVDPARPPELATYIQCQDCLAFRVGSLPTLLGPGMDRYKLAREVTDHLRTVRNYALSFAGYHVQGGGFWLSAAYWAHMGIFVLNADRGSRAAIRDPIDSLIQAFTSGVAAPPLAGMCDRNNYASRNVFLNAAVPPPANARALLTSAAVSQTRAPGYTAVTLAEFLPVSRGALPGALSGAAIAPAAVNSRASGSVARSAPASVARTLGSRCDTCGELVTERALLTSVYIGCRCG